MNSFDVLLDDDGDLPVVTEHVNDYRITMQRLCVRLSTHLREVIYDQFVGIPYREWAQQRPPQYTVWDQTIRNLILSCPGVGGLTNFQRVVINDETVWTGTIHEEAGEDLLITFSPFARPGQTENWHPVTSITISGLGRIR